MADLNDVLQAPTWTMDDAYVDIGSARYEESMKALADCVKALKAVNAVTRENIQTTLAIYDRGVMLHSSLTAFVKCLGAKNSNDDRVGTENSRLAGLFAELSQASVDLFKFVQTLPDDDELWTKSPLADWHFEIKDRNGHWMNRLSESDKAWYQEIERQCFTPLNDLFKVLQKGVDFEAVNSRGEKERIKAAKLVSVIKGNPDPVLRKNVFIGLNQSYGKRAELYAGLLNQLHGLRLVGFNRAGVTPLEVSLHQNRMSEKALMAMRSAILKHIEKIRESVTLRAPYFGGEKLAVYDLMCPAPKKGGVPALIPYAEGIETVKTALSSVSPEFREFIDMMLKNRWVEATVSDNKIGGAFYSRFNEFKIPRVFTSYMGNITTILQQGHELGHAFHYWMIRDLPTVQTEFPMTLTEMASTFDEAAIRLYLLNHAESTEERFEILWQELRSVANFLMNTMVRMDFELAFLKERQNGAVSAKRCVELMREAWHNWYGDSTEGADDYLWAYKLHYYKTDQLIYNYPYSVGYLLSQGLIYEFKHRKENFMPFYKAMLRDTGRLTLDELVAKHFQADATSEKFWEQCMEAPLDFVDRFKNQFRK